MPVDAVQFQIERIRRIALALPDTTEKLSHGEPTFFVGKRVFVMFVNNHHNDGHIAIWIPVPPGAQLAMIADAPDIYFKPPYVGVKGWVGVELARVDEAALTHLIHGALRLTARKAVAPRSLPRIDLLAACIAMASTCCAQQIRSAALSPLAFLSGTWVSDERNELQEETWSRVSGDSMTGSFRIVQSRKPVFYEFWVVELDDHRPAGDAGHPPLYIHAVLHRSETYP